MLGRGGGGKRGRCGRGGFDKLMGGWIDEIGCCLQFSITGSRLYLR